VKGMVINPLICMIITGDAVFLHILSHRSKYNSQFITLLHYKKGKRRCYSGIKHHISWKRESCPDILYIFSILRKWSQWILNRRFPFFRKAKDMKGWKEFCCIWFGWLIMRGLLRAGDRPGKIWANKKQRGKKALLFFGFYTKHWGKGKKEEA
jgi:hypothetical protein